MLKPHSYCIAFLVTFHLCHAIAWTQPISAPVLRYPIEGEAILHNGQVSLQWTPASPRMDVDPYYHLCVAEVMPGQTPVQALQSNRLLIDRLVGGCEYFLQPQDMPLLAGDSMHLVWIVVPETASGAYTYNLGVSRPEDFWLYDALHGVRFRQRNVSFECGFVSAGANREITQENNYPVVIGTPGEALYHYEWLSDPPGYHGYASQVEVYPAQTTRYVLFRTDTSTGCMVSDEVWVSVEKPFDLWVEVDPCGVLTARMGHVVAAQARSIQTQTQSGLSYRSDGRPDTWSGRWTAVAGDGYFELPAALTGPNGPVPQYRWSNGERTASMRPTLGEGPDFSVTVSVGRNLEQVAQVQYVPHGKFQGGFPELIYPRHVELGDVGDKGFRLHDAGMPGDANGTSYNAVSYRLMVVGSGYSYIHEGYTLDGFSDGAILWDQSADPRGHAPEPGKYHFRLTLRNCDCAENDPLQRLKLGSWKGGGNRTLGRRPGRRRLGGKFHLHETLGL